MLGIIGKKKKQQLQAKREKKRQQEEQGSDDEVQSASPTAAPSVECSTIVTENSNAKPTSCREATDTNRCVRAKFH